MGTPALRHLLVALVVMLVAAPLALRVAQLDVGLIGLLAAPVVIGVLFLLVAHREWLLVAILLVRPALDPLMGSFKSGGGMGPGAAFNALVILLGVLYLMRSPRDLARTRLLLWLPFLALAGLGVYNAEDRAVAGRSLMGYLSYFLMFAMPFLLVRTREDLRRWVLVLLMASAVPTAIGVWDLAHGGEAYRTATELEAAADGAVDALDGLEAEVEGMRVQGAFPHPNIFAFYILSVIGTLLLALYEPGVLPGGQARGPMVRRLALGYLLLQCVLLLATQTRSAWAACAMLFVAMAALVDRRLWKYLLVAPLLLLLVPSVQDRLLDLAQGNAASSERLNSYAWRVLMWKSAWPWIQERWSTGWGLDSFKQYSTVFFPLDYIQSFDAHNVYVQLAFEIGVFGSAAFALLFMGLAALSVADLHRHRAAAGLGAALAIAYLMGCYSDNMHRYLVANWYLFFVMGLLGRVVQGLAKPGAVTAWRVAAEVPHA